MAGKNKLTSLPRPFQAVEVDDVIRACAVEIPKRDLLLLPEKALAMASDVAPSNVVDCLLKKPGKLWKAVMLLYDEVEDAAAACARDLLHGITHLDTLWTQAKANVQDFKNSLTDDLLNNPQVKVITGRLTIASPELGKSYGRPAITATACGDSTG